MGILKQFSYWQYKRFVKGACRAMLINFNVAGENTKTGKLHAPLMSDLAAYSLSTRPGWKALNARSFQHNSGETIDIQDDDSLATVTLSVILVEMEEYLLKEENPIEALKIITDAWKAFFSAPEDLLTNNKRYTQTLGAAAMENIKRNGYYKAS